MFSGIIQSTGRLEARTARGGGARLVLSTPRPLPRLALGESVAVNGACLTVAGRNGRRFTADVSPETLRRTTLGRLAPGTRVNLERALRLGDRIGGHIVQGHVDAVGRLDAITPEGDWVLFRFSAPAALAPFLVEKGSVAVDGVSLTVFRCRKGGFSVALVPHTLRETTLGERRPGDRVNLEADILLKHIAALVRTRRGR
ncbi:MAG TPA: riboflavin synthase [Candidatus Binatia bacterium]|nr:riboflavin synthase [Candidatus Binatia bacterium]